jgi:hypothetical protein
MKVQDKEQKHPPFDVAAGMAAGLLADGRYVKVEPVIKKPIPDLRWFARKGNFVGGSFYPPFIWAHCPSCGGKWQSEGPSITTTLVIRHCGATETVPPGIAAEYDDLRRKYYKSTSRRTRNDVLPAKAPTLVVGL